MTLRGYRLHVRLSLVFVATLSAGSAFGACNTLPSLQHFYSETWGIDSHNTRFQPLSDISSTNVDTLQLEWVFALGEGMSPHSYPIVSDDTIFIGSSDGVLYALDRDTGCVRWRFDADSEIRSGVVQGRSPDGRVLLFFGTFSGHAHAVDAATGASIWRVDVKDHPFSVVTGTPHYDDGRLFVPISSMEVALALVPFYGCCTSRGAVVALDADDGTLQWRTHVIPDEPQVTGRHLIFVEKWGPSGAPVWSSPTVDAERGLIFVGTGENYTRPTSATSDSIIAIDRNNGDIRWVQQYTAQDAFNLACSLPNHPNCPENAGPDLDFGAPPIVAHTESGDSILLAGQKSGGVYGIDPATGARLWSVTIGRGGYLGGVHWGMAVNERLGLLFAPISDIDAGPAKDVAPAPGLYALDIATGAARWSKPIDDNCANRAQCRVGLSAAIMATDELVFAGALDGMLYAYDAASGEELWRFDTWREFQSVNELPTRGGAIDVHGPMIAGDMLFIQSGYGVFGQRGGNALLAFKLTTTAERSGNE